MDEALVQNAEHDIGGEDRGENQDALPFERILEHLRGALETGGDGRRQIAVAFELLNLLHRLAKRDAGRKVERDGDRGLLALMIDLQRPDGRHKLRHRRERNGRAGQIADTADARRRPDLFTLTALVFR